MPYGLAGWIDVIKNSLHSKLPEKELRKKILADCLVVPYIRFGSYQVDPRKIWENIVSKDQTCAQRLKDLKIDSYIRLLEHCDERDYRRMRDTFPKNHHKKGR